MKFEAIKKLFSKCRYFKWSCSAGSGFQAFLHIPIAHICREAAGGWEVRGHIRYVESGESNYQRARTTYEAGCPRCKIIPVTKDQFEVLWKLAEENDY